MPSEYCYEYPTRIRKIIIPTSSNSNGLFEFGSLPKIPGRFHPFGLPPPSDSLLRDMKSERILPIPPKSRIMERVMARSRGNDYLDSELDPILLKPRWSILDIPRENVEEEVDCDDDEEEDYSDDHIEQRDLVKQTIPSAISDFLLEVPRIHTNQTCFPSDLLELSHQSEHFPLDKSAFELSEDAVSKVWVNPQYEAILKRKSDEEGDSLDAKKRKTN